MISINVVTLLGKSGEVSLGKTANGTSFCRVEVSTFETFKGKDGTEQTYETWHRVVFWNALAESYAENVRPGSYVFVTGRLQTRNYEHEGQKKKITEIVGREYLVSKLSKGELNEVTDRLTNEATGNDVPF